MEGVKRGFEHRTHNGVEYLQSSLINATGLTRHGFFTRIGGVSPAPYDTLNFSLKREGSRENLAENLRRAGECIGVDEGDCAIVNYEHGSNVLVVDGSVRGQGVRADNTLPHSDGFAARTNDVALVTIHADCVPLFFVAPDVGAIALCHAGWRGVYTHITMKAADALRAMGARAADMICAVGPAIGPCCFEVGEGLCARFVAEFGDVSRQEDGRSYVDLFKCVVSDLMCVGLNPGNIEVAGECTSCDPVRYFSHRRDREAHGSMASIMQLI